MQRNRGEKCRCILENSASFVSVISSWSQLTFPSNFQLLSILSSSSISVAECTPVTPMLRSHTLKLSDYYRLYHHIHPPPSHHHQANNHLMAFGARSMCSSSKKCLDLDLPNAEPEPLNNYSEMYAHIFNGVPLAERMDSSARPPDNLLLTHTDSEGRAKMVDVGEKIITLREARAQAVISVGAEVMKLLKEDKMKKGDVLTVAQLAGIGAAKRTAQLIPLCHNINLTKVDVMCRLNEDNNSVEIQSLVRCVGKTGVEMEALTAASVAALTVYDMCKAVTHNMVITDLMLLSKSGGKKHFSR